MPLLVPEQRTPEWFDAHLWRITSSNAAGTLGIDPWDGPLATFNAITGKTKKNDNPAMKWGRENEQKARMAYEVETGNVVRETGFWVHPEYDWLGASPDGFIGEDGLVEIKCPKNRLPESVPSHHEIQMMVQMLVTGRQWCDYWVWMPDAKPFLCRVKRDLEQEKYILFRLKEFYDCYVFPDVAPPRRRPA